ncbi:transcriptional repressor [Ruficoccus amylovorans]|uniref:Transcriptional repressor n=1 Tax=Ruficoccus amylovorans TaxID=1804625 RepID=A0A842HCY6_9BACT|nr:transcriptional repressor [Ruficoccus amylovorans]MBC2594282.1 transcriptional repressor [Ruficoccus amylovorans]
MPPSVRETRQRTAIRNALQSQNRPLKPKEIQELAQQECKSLGIATVYRNLRTMLEDGLVEKLEIPGLATCYSLPREIKRPILVCQRTGQIHWLKTRPADVDLSQVPPNFEYEGHEIIVYGQFQT